MIINIRGTSGSGKSTLAHKLLENNPASIVLHHRILNGWKKAKVVAYSIHKFNKHPIFIIGSYKTQCGGCDSLSYKGSHTDIENMVREFAAKGNVIFEGLTISSTISRWLNISKDFPGQYIWAFMDTPEEECYKRILARSGREPKRDAKGVADYNRKYSGCMRHYKQLEEQGEQVMWLSSDNIGYQKLLEILD